MQGPRWFGVAALTITIGVPFAEEVHSAAGVLDERLLELLACNRR